MSTSQVNLFEQVTGYFKGTKAAIEALPNVGEGSIAYAIDTNEFGSYDGAAWTWGQGGSGTLDGLSDVIITNPQLGDFLAYDDDDDVWINLPRTFYVQPSQVRERLSANRTYYVRTHGNDSNTGLVNNAGGAFLTIQKAIDVVSALDISTYTVTIQVADGAYNAALTLKDPVGSGSCILLGNTTTPANVTITTTIPITSVDTTLWTVNGFKLQASGSYCVSVAGGLLTLSNIHYGTSAFAHIGSLKYGLVTISTNYTIAGAAAGHFYCESGRIDCRGRTVTLTGTPAFTNFAWVTQLGYLLADGNTFSGAGTGARYSVALNGVINTGAGGANYFPGNAAGSSATGGQYA